MSLGGAKARCGREEPLTQQVATRRLEEGEQQRHEDGKTHEKHGQYSCRRLMNTSNQNKRANLLALEELPRPWAKRDSFAGAGEENRTGGCQNTNPR
jgi:hypothetical protein